MDSKLNFEVLNENVYYFPEIIKNIKSLLLEIETFNSESVSNWEIWHANSDPNSPEYGILKTFNTSLLEKETDVDKKIRAKNLMFSILEAMELSAREYLISHGASEKELDALKKSLFEDPMPYAIRKYNPNESMGPHTDRFSEDKDTITIAVYLNDDYVGGEISVVEPGVDVTIKTKAGSIVVFPSSYLHESKPLISGRKTIITHVHTTLEKL